jgi:hypothetical protein
LIVLVALLAANLCVILGGRTAKAQSSTSRFKVVVFQAGTNAKAQLERELNDPEGGGWSSVSIHLAHVNGDSSLAILKRQ